MYNSVVFSMWLKNSQYQQNQQERTFRAVFYCFSGSLFHVTKTRYHEKLKSISLILHSTCHSVYLCLHVHQKCYGRIYLKRKVYCQSYKGTLFPWPIYKNKTKFLSLLPAMTYYINLWNPLSVTFFVTLLFNLWIVEINVLRKISSQMLNSFLFRLVKIHNFIKYFWRIVAFKLFSLSWVIMEYKEWIYIYIIWYILYIIKSHYAVFSC